MKFLIVFVAIVSCLMLSCESKKNVKSETKTDQLQSETEKSEDTTIVVVRDHDWKPRMCWKGLDDWNVAPQGGGIVITRHDNERIYVSGNVFIVYNTTMGEAAELLGVNLNFCVNGRYVEK